MSKFLCLAAVIVFASCACRSNSARNRSRVSWIRANRARRRRTQSYCLTARDMSHWIVAGGGPAKCDVRDSAMACTTGVGDILQQGDVPQRANSRRVRHPFHARSEGSVAGNSGVYVQGATRSRCWIPTTIPPTRMVRPERSTDSMLLSVNASRPPEQWQTYDIIFRAPKCDAAGNVTEKRPVDAVAQRCSGAGSRGNSERHRAAVQGRRVQRSGPLMLQDHSGFKDAPLTVMRYRNIWFRHLE
jgi:hypothetical protein